MVTDSNFSLNPPNGTVFVRVRSVSNSGVLSEPSEPLKVQFGALPKDGITDITSYPNPFDSRRENATIHSVLGANSDVPITLYSVFGGKVRELKFSAGGQGGAAGSNDVIWDGTDTSGRKVSKGMYLAVMDAGGAHVTYKLAVIH